MKHVLLIFIPIVTLILIAGAAIGVYFDSPSETDYKLARGWKLLEAENFLAALEILRGIPLGQARDAETHSYLGFAYLRLHLYHAAMTEFEAALEQGARSFDPRMGLASTYIQLGDTAKALEQARRAVEAEEGSAEAWIMLGRAHWLEREFEQAEKAGLRARELSPDSPAITELLLHIYFDQDRPDKFEPEMDRSPQPSRAIQDLAVQFYVRQGQFAPAYDVKNRFERDNLELGILEAELALRRDPERLDLYPQLIKNLVRTGRFRDAIKFTEQYSGPVPVDLELGKAYWMLGQRERAIRHYRRASDRRIHKLSAEIAMAAITGNIRHWREAFRAERIERDYFVLAQLQDILPAADGLVRSFIYRYAAIYDQRFYNMAAEEALKVLNGNSDVDALFTIGTAYHRLGRLNEARRYLELARELYPYNAEAWSRLASVTVSSADIETVADLMERAVELDAHNPGYLYNLGWIYDQMGDTMKAASLYQQAIQASSLSFEAMNNLALIYTAAGRSEQALALLEQAIRNDPEVEAGYFNIAGHYVRQRQWMQALDSYERVLRINPLNVDAAVEYGRVLLGMGRIEQGVESLNRALEVDPGSFDAYMLLSSAYEKLGHNREALAAAEEARRIRPGTFGPPAVFERLDQVDLQER